MSTYPQYYDSDGSFMTVWGTQVQGIWLKWTSSLSTTVTDSSIVVGTTTLTLDFDFKLYNLNLSTRAAGDSASQAVGLLSGGGTPGFKPYLSILNPDEANWDPAANNCVFDGLIQEITLTAATGT